METDRLMDVFRIGADDLAANRSGRLGPAQVRRLRRGATQTAAATAAILIGLLAIVDFVGTRPFNWVQYTIVGTLVAIGIGAASVAVRHVLTDIRYGRVECFTGLVVAGPRGRNGWWLAVNGQSFRLTARIRCSGQVPFHVYVVPASKQVVAMEPA